MCCGTIGSVDEIVEIENMTESQNADNLKRLYSQALEKIKELETKLHRYERKRGKKDWASVGAIDQGSDSADDHGLGDGEATSARPVKAKFIDAGARMEIDYLWSENKLFRKEIRDLQEKVQDLAGNEKKRKHRY